MITDIIKSLFSKAFTRKYPKEKIKVPRGFRTRTHVWNKDLCIYCKICENNCPTGCITVDKENKRYTVELSKCIFCGTCESKCPTNAIKLSGDIPLGSYKKKTLMFE